LVPYTDHHYYQLRPNIAIPAPDGSAQTALALDSTFALHPALALVFFGASMVYYARLSWRFTGCMLLVSSVMLAVVDALDARGVLVPVSVLVFVVAWIFQFIGHRIEGKKPSFFEDVQYLWVGPLFVLSKGFLRLGVRW
jgi:uncharacterized membrane protein YGL010W